VSDEVGDGVKVGLVVGVGVPVGVSDDVGDGLDVDVWVGVREGSTVELGNAGGVAGVPQLEANNKMAKSHIHFVECIF